MRLKVLGQVQLPLLVLLLCALPAHAGMFEMESANAVIRANNDGYLAVEVQGQARYVGTVDPNDVSYQINTLLNHNRDGGSLTTWSTPDAEGNSLTCSGDDCIYPNMVISCTGSCAAYANLYRKNCPSTFNYKGRGVVTIYHQYTPEIDPLDTGVYLVNCYTPDPVDDDDDSGGGGGDDCDPGVVTAKRGGLGTRAGSCEGTGSPILIDLGSRGFHLTDVAGGVTFDIDGDGNNEQISWTESESGDAFLALDRDGNGRIDSGRELFGDATAQPPSDEPNGYLALSEFDLDRDGRITSADPIYSHLLLWEDSNHDGVSQPNELANLTDRRVAVIELDFKESRRRDRHGNYFRYRSRVRMNDEGAVMHRPSVDIFFRIAS